MRAARMPAHRKPNVELMPATANQRKSSGPRAYAPHATQRMESLAGLPLASFQARAAAFLMDMVLVLLAYIPVMVVIRWLAAGRKLACQHRR